VNKSNQNESLPIGSALPPASSRANESAVCLVAICFYFTRPTSVAVVATVETQTTTIIKNESALVRLYLDTVRDTVCGLTLRTQEQSVRPSIEANKFGLNLEQRIVGLDWPSIGITMIGQTRLKNIESSLRLVIANNVPGDFIECGVWRGGGSIFARAVLKALEITDRHVWAVDSFQGLPRARTQNDHDEWSKQTYLRVRKFRFICISHLNLNLGFIRRSSNKFSVVFSSR